MRAWIISMLLLTTACTSAPPGPDADDQPSERSTSQTGTATDGATAGEAAPPTVEPTAAVRPDVFPAATISATAARRKWSDAISQPVRDTLFPDFGNPGIDVLHYDLRLAWQPLDRQLSGHETVTFRAVTDNPDFTLDLSAALVVSDARLDGRRVRTSQSGHRVRVHAPVVADSIRRLQLTYAGEPRGTGERFRQGSGVQVHRSGALATFQQPFGAWTWFAANDQPSDKAYYDFTLDVPEPFQGVANGVQTATTTADGVTSSTWHLDSPASTYLVTVGFGPYEHTVLDGVDGIEISLWTDPRNQSARDVLSESDRGLAWLRKRLGPYPFDSLGFVVTAGAQGGMETQTLITMSDIDMDDYLRGVAVHEMAHQWWGNLVTPADWNDLWMNEGMATYLERVWRAEDTGVPLDQTMADVRRGAQRERTRSGPPGQVRPSRFGQANVYTDPSLMWHALRADLGDPTFWRLVREWPQTHRYASVTRAELVAWWSAESGRDLSGFFERWLTDPRLPAA